MAQVYLSLGSNIQQRKNIRSCIAVLEECFGELTLSPVYESEAVGFAGDNFFNLVVKINTELSVGDLLVCLRKIEDDHGRIRKCERFSARTLDIDILTYDDVVGTIDGVELPRDEILKNAFVLWPMADVAADVKHPLTHKTYAHHWQAFDRSSQRLWQVEL
ncbi:MAG: 2-amino-4-hydroxy-6-hydroxymethyldihydropteridine diphosphokinase [Pseudomonadales bacterium]|nr:2-amino-4-hydroxy-6-hydroxymethyldihydropteridine diphosphokinase [Pseudomonadales bacterium]